jgi:hypothetical protein
MSDRERDVPLRRFRGRVRKQEVVVVNEGLAVKYQSCCSLIVWCKMKFIGEGFAS